jgi:hypothetical protein
MRLENVLETTEAIKYTAAEVDCTGRGAILLRLQIYTNKPTVTLSGKDI